MHNITSNVNADLVEQTETDHFVHTVLGEIPRKTLDFIGIQNKMWCKNHQNTIV